jgi:hypothetical protein
MTDWSFIKQSLIFTQQQQFLLHTFKKPAQYYAGRLCFINCYLNQADGNINIAGIKKAIR